MAKHPATTGQPPTIERPEMIDLDRPEPELCPAAFDWLVMQILEPMKAPDLQGLHVSYTPDKSDKEWPNAPPIDKLPPDEELAHADAAAALQLSAYLLTKHADRLLVRPKHTAKNGLRFWAVSDLRFIRQNMAHT